MLYFLEKFPVIKEKKLTFRYLKNTIKILKKSLFITIFENNYLNYFFN